MLPLSLPPPPDKDSRKNLASSRFQDSQSALNFPGLWRHYSGLDLRVPWAPSLCVCPGALSFLEGRWSLDLGLTLIPYNLILTNYISIRPCF